VISLLRDKGRRTLSLGRLLLVLAFLGAFPLTYLHGDVPSGWLGLITIFAGYVLGSQHVASRLGREPPPGEEPEP